MTIIEALLIYITVNIACATELNCPNSVTCPCGKNGGNVTICITDAAGNPDVCASLSKCESCQEGSNICSKCPEGFEGLHCSRRIQKSREKRQFGRPDYTPGRTRPGASSTQSVSTCPTLDTANLGSIVCGMTNGEGQNCTGKCWPGYHFVMLGSEAEVTLTCVRGSWTPLPSFPDCIENPVPEMFYCGDPGTNINSIRQPNIPPNPLGYPQGSRVVYSCNKGFELVGDESIFCLTSGKWTKKRPKCVPQNITSEQFQRLPTFCRDPGFVSNSVRQSSTSPRSEGFPEGTQLDYACVKDYDLIGDKVIVCQESSEWSGSPPRCVPQNPDDDGCADLPVPIGGSVAYVPETSSNENLGEADQPMALAGPIPSNLPFPKHEKVPLAPNLHQLGTRAIFSCVARYYKLIGSKTRRCLKNGKWSGRSTICTPECGRSESRRSPFVSNANATDMGQWPWQAGIARWNSKRRWSLDCGGSLVNEFWLITAAHCVTYSGTTATLATEKFQIYLGKYHRSDIKDDAYVQVRKVQEIHIHPNYEPSLLDADIALIHLDSPVQLNSRVLPVCLPTEQSTRENIVEGKRGVVTGWGMEENRTRSETLKQAVLPVISHRNCEKGYKESGLHISVTNNMFCAGYKNGRGDACSADSGNSMVFLDESEKEQKWVLEGIVSWGSPRGCGIPNQYTGFTLIGRFLDWIHFYF